MELGNQQERLIGWLSGMVDADGSIGIHRQPFGEQVTYVPSISLTTSCAMTRDVLKDVLRSFMIGSNITERIPKNPNWSKVWVFNTRGMQRVERFINVIGASLVTKNREAQLVMQFIRERQSRPRAAPYTQSELLYVEQLKTCKSRNLSLSSTTICQAPNVIG